MRQPRYLSYSSLALWEKDKEEFYIRNLSDLRAPRMPQERFAAVGSAFDAYAKSELYDRLFGKLDPAFEFATLFPAQVEEQNRDWGLVHGKFIFDRYVHSGSFDELLAKLQQSIEPPVFESKVDGLVGGVPFTGKPDLRWVMKLAEEPLRIVLDWKVKGYCSKYSTSPSKGYALCRDGYDAVKLGVGKTKAAPDGKQSRSHGTSHALYLPINHRGLEISAGWMESCNSEYADQISIYGWLLGEQPGDENVVVWIDEIVADGKDNPKLLRVANHRARVRRDYQMELVSRIKSAWHCITTGHIFTEVSKDESVHRCQMLEKMVEGLQSSGTPEDEWFNEVVRKGYRR